MRKSVCGAICLPIVLTFIASTTRLAIADTATTTPQDVGAVFKQETRVHVGPCIFAPPPLQAKPQEFKALIAPVVGAALIAAGLDFVDSAIQEAAREQSVQAVLAFPATAAFYELTKDGQLDFNKAESCIQVLVGGFRDGLSLPADPKNPDWNSVEATQPIKFPSYKEYPHTADGKAITWPPETTRDQGTKGAKTLTQTLQEHYRQLTSVKLFFEARIDTSPGLKSLFRLAPNALYFGDPLEHNWSDWSTPVRNLLVSISFIRGADGQNSTFASVTFPFRELPAHTFISPLYFLGNESQWLHTPAPTDSENSTIQGVQNTLKQADIDEAAKLGKDPEKPTDNPNNPNSPDAPWRNPTYLRHMASYCDRVARLNGHLKAASQIKATSCPYDKDMLEAQYLASFELKVMQWQANKDAAQKRLSKKIGPNLQCTKSAKDGKYCTLAKSRVLAPYSVTASVVEIKDASKFVGFLANVADKAKPGLTTELQNKISPSVKSQAAETQAENYENYLVALDAVKVAQAALDEAATEDKPSKQLALLQAQVAANRAARAANQSEPYPDASGTGK